MNKILIVEDSSDIVSLVKRCLGSGVQLEWAKTIGEATRIVNKKNFDLIILDVLLPDGDGFRFCSLIRANEEFNGVPVIFLTSRNTLSDQIFGFSVGCDDYVPKPFDSMELRARIEAKLRRRNQEIARAQTLRIGDLEINKDTQRVRMHGTDNPLEVELTPLEFKILVFLAKEPNKVISRQMILSCVWGTNVHVYNRSIDTHVSKLRKKLGPKADYIVSVHGTGYRFVPPEAAPPLADLERIGHRLQIEPVRLVN